MDSILSGIIGGIIGVILCTFISSKVRNRSKDGALKFGIFVMGLGWVCLFATLGLLYVTIFIDHGEQYIPLTCLITGFGLGAIYTLGEAFIVNGKFDKKGIKYHTPWTGTKNEKWDDLVNIKFNSTANWYTLAFQSGAKVRLSTLLGGHNLVLKHVKSLGHNF